MTKTSRVKQWLTSIFSLLPVNISIFLLFFLSSTPNNHTHDSLAKSCAIWHVLTTQETSFPPHFDCLIDGSNQHFGTKTVDPVFLSKHAIRPFCFSEHSLLEECSIMLKYALHLHKFWYEHKKVTDSGGLVTKNVKCWVLFSKSCTRLPGGNLMLSCWCYYFGCDKFLTNENHVRLLAQFCTFVL